MRTFSLLGLLTLNFMIVFVISDAAGQAGQQHVLEPAGSVEAQIGADHPGEIVHLTGAVAALVIGASGLLGLLINPHRAGSAIHTAAVAGAWLATSFVVGNPDNHGGQASQVDLAFAALALPPLVAVALAAPWRAWSTDWLARPRLLILAVLGVPWIWHGITQGLMQRNTWPPMADPHHQAHWFAASLLAFTLPLLVGGSALAGPGWMVAAMSAGTAAVALAVASLAAPDAASALNTASAATALLWGLATLAVTMQQARRARARMPKPTRY